MKKRMFSTLLAMCIALMLLPTTTLAEEIASGECGANGYHLNWVLNDTGVLTINGSGRMEEYSYLAVESPPWDDLKDAIQEVHIGQGVTYISSWAFANCENITKVTIPDSVTGIGGLTFWNCKKITDITLPNSIKKIDYRAFDGCESLRSINIPTGLQRLENSLFSGCKSLTDVIIPSNITSIGGYVFSGCESLTNVIIPDSVTSMEGGVFSGCSTLNSVSLPKNITTINSWTFSSCHFLTDVVIPSRVTSIEMYAFSGCDELTSVTIPVLVSQIKSTAFDNCEALTDVYYSGTKAKWETITIGTANEPLTQATIHCSDGVINGPSSMVPTRADFACALPTNLIYDGTSKTAAVLGGVSSPVHSGNFTLSFTDAQNNAVNDLIYAGAYHVLANVNAHDNYEAASVDLGTVIIKEVPGLHGAVAVSATFPSEADGTTYTIGGETVTLHVAPDPGYKVGTVQVITSDGTKVPLSQSGNNYSFTMPAADVHVNVKFIEI